MGVTIEDAARLRPDDARHISKADSATVCRRIEDGLSGRTRLRTKAANELIIRPRLETVLSLVEEYELNLTIALVRSADNKADGLTIVLRHWSVPNEPPVVSTCEAGVCEAADNPSTMRLIADIHHASGCPGHVVGTCDACQSIDPAPAKWRHGVLEVGNAWQKVSMDCRNDLYLTLNDCGPLRLTIWRCLHQRSSAATAQHLEAIFYVRGAHEELLGGNDTAFQSREVSHMAERWGVLLRFRCA
ncbi:hypothetical protein M513_09331 [Trichuris suis]|uniref:Integrase catalytic domain-containing protein n=1 Tax=Trichuris suis TaxID=68888 RepID=A0A085LY18_9BILA|nr:hypothetical protein M513_09331 [Trichuris suis]